MMFISTVTTVDPKDMLRLIIQNLVAYDTVTRIGLQQSRGRSRRGTGQHYVVVHFVDEWNPYAKVWRGEPVFIAKFKAADDAEAIDRMFSHRAVKYAYSRIWQKLLSDVIAAG